MQPTPGASDLRAEIVELRVAVAAMAVPSPVLDGWSSPAALEFGAAAVRLSVGLHRLIGDLDGAAAALAAP